MKYLWPALKNINNEYIELIVFLYNIVIESKLWNVKF